MSLSTKQKVVCIAGAVALVIGLSAVVREMASSSVSAASQSRKEIEARSAALAVKSRTSESLAEKVARFRAALSKDDFAEATKIVGDVSAHNLPNYWSNSLLTEFMVSAVDYNDPDVERHLDAWVLNSKQKSQSLIVRAQYKYSLGWNARGVGFYSAIRPADLPVFRKYMTEALSDVNSALQIGEKSPALYYLKLQILRNEGTLQDKLLVFQETIKAHPDFYPIYQLMLSILQPKWGGSIQAMHDFAEMYAGKSDQYSSLRLLYLDLYKDLVDAAVMTCMRSQARVEDKPACVASAMDRMGGSDVQDKLRGAFLLYNHTDRYQFGLAIREPLEAIMSWRGAEPYASYALQTAANAMHSDIRLVEDRPGQNDYVIDQLVAASWYRAGNFENAIRKEKEALEDLRLTKFPDGESKDLALAGVYLHISTALAKLRDYAGQAAYQRASYVLGGRNGYEHATCFALYKIGSPDDVLPACDQAVADNTDNMETYYWRARANLDRKREDAAIPDLERVAGSRHIFRDSAAIELSMIWFARKDMAAALRTLNAYPNLYDSAVTSRESVAVAYNNRCYAYMQLGDMRKALADCNNSLKFGNIPDAYKKKEELEKRLASLPI